MSWRGTQAESRTRHLAHYDSDEIDRYEAWVAQLSQADDEACLCDLAPEFQLQRGMSVLDVGAGTGAMCRILKRVAGISITALEPAPQMIARLSAKPEFRDVTVVQGFSDSAADRELFGSSAFDAIVSRQLVNGLFDPIAAFRNWYDWLKISGTLVVIDGLFDRSAWTGQLQEEVDMLPLSACRTSATTPYLLETVGFDILSVKQMATTNSLPSTRTKRYAVIATKRA